LEFFNQVWGLHLDFSYFSTIFRIYIILYQFALAWGLEKALLMHRYFISVFGFSFFSIRF